MCESLIETIQTTDDAVDESRIKTYARLMDEQFAFVKRFPKTISYKLELKDEDHTVICYPALTFINGEEVQEGAMWIGTDTLERAIAMTKARMKELESKNHIWVRKFPELIRSDGAYYIKTRLVLVPMRAVR